MGSLAYRTTRKISTKLRRRSKVTKSICKILVNPARNPVRNQLYDAQIRFYNILVQRRQLRRKLAEHTNGSRIYKCAFIKKIISGKNKDERVTYSEEYKDKPIEDF
jgi:hypothetical protein